MAKSMAAVGRTEDGELVIHPQRPGPFDLGGVMTRNHVASIEELATGALEGHVDERHALEGIQWRAEQLRRQLPGEA